jgi:hypothetical protein
MPPEVFRAAVMQFTSSHDCSVQEVLRGAGRYCRIEPVGGVTPHSLIKRNIIQGLTIK